VLRLKVLRQSETATGSFKAIGNRQSETAQVKGVKTKGFKESEIC
jgi:hypothetical protein